MDYEGLAKSFWEQGYLVLDKYFADEVMDELNDLILDHYGKSPEFYHNDEFLEKSNTEVIPWFPQKEGVKAFDVVSDDANINALSEQILGSGWKALYCMSMFSKQGTKGQAWHQDCPPEDPKQFNMNRLVYTGDITSEIGGQTVIVPGSHKRGVLPVSDKTHEDYPDQLILEPKKGTVVFLHGHTWHRVLPVNGEYRVSTNYRCAPEGTPDDITDTCVYPNMRYYFPTNEVVEERVPGAKPQTLGY